MGKGNALKMTFKEELVHNFLSSRMGITSLLHLVLDIYFKAVCCFKMELECQINTLQLMKTIKNLDVNYAFFKILGGGGANG